MTNKFVVVIDAQNDFIQPTGALAVSSAASLIPAMQAYLDALSPDEVEGVLFTFDTHDPEAYAVSEEGKQFPIHCVKGTWGWENVLDIDAVASHVTTYVLEKDVFNMWQKDTFLVRLYGYEEDDPIAQFAPPTVADTFFDDLKDQGITEIEVIGVASDYCVHWAVEGFVKRGFNVTVKRDLVKGIARDIDQVVAEEYAGVANLKIA